ncbi:MAG: AAA family ATPase [Oscillatoria sp. SIO1A7]|nr:AAA family ATPase [Oscillatoria sp. SIO1A7]
MLKTLRLQNFRAFQDTGDIELKPIVVLAGPNSSGKTSILKSLLLLKQTLEMGRSGDDLNLDGRFLQLSAFNELTFGKPPLNDCKVSYKVTVENSIDYDLALSLAKRSSYPNLKLPNKAESVRLKSEINFGFKYQQDEPRGKISVDFFNLTSFLDSSIYFKINVQIINKLYKVDMDGFSLPDYYEAGDLYTVLWRYFWPTGLLFTEKEEFKGKPYHKKINNGSLLIYLKLDPVSQTMLQDFEEELVGRLEYLGPLREEPHRAYPHSGSSSSEIGQKGENAAQILWLEKDSPVSYLPELGAAVSEVKLIDAVNDVFHKMGIGQPVSVNSEQSVMYQILFGLGEQGQKTVTIADVGFGASQLLPVVVMGLRADDSSLLMFEHPEIHLHPKLQANLADFFLTLAMSGKRILVETHSDRFINRLRRRIAEDTTDELKDKISILFVRPGENGEGSTIEPMRIDRYGVIENWPPDFLPEAADEAEAIFRAGLEKRRGK